MGIPPVRVEFSPEGTGWAHCKLSIGDAIYEATGVSDTTDPLGDLLRAALVIVTGAPRAELSFDGEPVETRWVLERNWMEDRQWATGFRVRLLTFEDIYAHAPESAGIEVFNARCDAADFARAVLAGAERLIQPKNDSWLTGPSLNYDGSECRTAVRALRSALNG